MNEFKKLAKIIEGEGYYAKVRNFSENQQSIMVGTDTQKNEIGINVILNAHFISMIDGIWRIEMPSCGESDALFSSKNIDGIFIGVCKLFNKFKVGRESLSPIVRDRTLRNQLTVETPIGNLLFRISAVEGSIEDVYFSECEIEPNIPKGMTVDGCKTVLLRCTSITPLKDIIYSCSWKDLKELGYGNSGEGLEAP